MSDPFIFMKYLLIPLFSFSEMAVFLEKSAIPLAINLLPLNVMITKVDSIQTT